MKKLFLSFLFSLLLGTSAWGIVAGSPPEYSCATNYAVTALLGSDNPVCNEFSALGQLISFISPVEVADECAGLETYRRNSGDTAYECFNPWLNAILAGTTQLAGRTDLTGVLTPATITANQNDYNPTNLATATVLRLSADSTWSITGIAGGSNGRILHLLNVGSNPITFVNQSTSSSAANRFSFWGATNSLVLILPNDQIAIIYDGTDSRWRILGAKQTKTAHCEIIIPSPVASDEYEFCDQPFDYIDIWMTKCESYGTCTTPPTIKLCAGEDLGDDTCATQITTMTCSTSGGETFDTADLYDQGVTVLITNTPSADCTSTRIGVYYHLFQ